ncbi:hypothetical protein D9M71_653070 [compost metagenome]
MLHRIVVDVVDMPVQVGFIAYLVFPESALPDAFLSSLGLARRALLIGGNRLGELALDQAPAVGVLAVAFGQCPERMQMVRQYADGDGSEG